MNDKTMTVLAATLQDALALAAAAGLGARLSIGPGQDGIIAPSGPVLSAGEAAQSLKNTAGSVFFAFGSLETTGIAAIAAPVIDRLCAATGLGFMAACLASPSLGRTIYQGHLFENGALKENLLQSFSLALEGGVGLIPQHIVAAGPAAIRRQAGALKEQGKTLALIDAISEADCAAIAVALAAMPLTGGSAFLCPAPEPAPEPAQPAGPLAILSGALARQTIYQIGAARHSLPVFDLDFTQPDPAAPALAWAKAKTSPFIITSSVPPDKITPGVAAGAALACIAQGLAASGVTRFILCGSATAAAILAALGITSLTTGAAFGPLRWMQSEKVSICVKPGGFGPGNLFLHEIEPQIRLNAAVELAS